MRPASIAALGLVALLGASFVATFGPASYAVGQAAATSTTCTPTTSPFLVTGAAWGSQSSPFGAAPGDLDVPLTVTLLYTGSCALTAASFQLTLPQPFTAVGGSNRTTTYEVNVGTDQILAETYHVSIGAGAQPGSYALPMYIGYNTTEFFGIFFQSVSVTVSMEGSVALAFSANTTTLSPGEVNNITLSISNQGTGGATSVSTTLTAPSEIGVLTRVPTVQSILPGSTSSQLLQVYVPATLAGSAFSLTVAATYYDAYSMAATASQTLGFSVSQLGMPSVALVQANATLTVGTQSEVTFTLTNTGDVPIYAPSFALTTSSPVVVTGIHATDPELTLQPGQSIKYGAMVGSSPSSTPGIYGGSATVTYLDDNGVQHDQAFPAGFLVRGSVQLLFQDVTVSQAATSLTVSGSLLNEGNANAYYAQVSGRIGGAPAQNDSTYVGEIDPNTPTPFTVTISFPAPGRAQQDVPVVLTVAYKDSFGTVSNSTSSVDTNLESAGEIALGSSTATGGSGASGGGLVTIVSYSIIILIAVVVVAAAVFIRRNRSSGKPSSGDKVI